MAGFSLCNSTDVDEVRETVGKRFCDHRLARRSARGGFDARFNHVQGGALGLGYLRYGGDVEIEPGHLDTFYLLQVPIRGKSEVVNGPDRAVTEPGTASMLNPTRPTWMRMTEECEKIMLQIDRITLHSMVERHLDLTLSQPIVFDSLVSFETPGLQQWRHNLTTCVNAASAGGLFGQNNRVSQMLIEEELITGFVQAQPSNVRHFFDKPTPEMTPGHLRRAQNFLHDSASEPVTVADVAKAVGVSVRSLQLSFKKHFGCGPLQYLRQLRLDLVRYELQSAKPDQKIAEIAFGLGFMHLGRFSIAYRQRFGETPSETRRDCGGRKPSQTV